MVPPGAQHSRSLPMTRILLLLLLLLLLPAATQALWESSLAASISAAASVDEPGRDSVSETGQAASSDSLAAAAAHQVRVACVCASSRG